MKTEYARKFIKKKTVIGRENLLIRMGLNSNYYNSETDDIKINIYRVIHVTCYRAVS